MSTSQRFEEYMRHLATGPGHVDRHAGLKGYSTGLMLPPPRKSVEPMAARMDPLARERPSSVFAPLRGEGRVVRR